MRITITLFLLVLTTAVFSQSYTVTGTVTDASDNSALSGAYAFVQNLENDTQAAEVTSEQGAFLLKNLPAGRYALTISFLGFETYQDTLWVNQNIQLERIALASGSVNLEQVEIKEQVLATQQIGDTTQFDARAFKTNPDASAQDLLEKMPGVINQNGRIQAQGEEVREVFVDGKPFFGKDTKAALQSLPADVVDKIQVFDQESEQSQFTGFSDGETTKAINIITKSNAKTGQFGNVYGGYGSDQTYSAGGLVNIFNGDQRISIIGQTNNINRQNFSKEDLVGVFGSQGGRGGRRRGGRGGGSASDFLVDQQNGITQTHAFGLNFSDEWGKKLKMSGSYFFNKTDNDAVTILSQDYVSTNQEGQQYDERSNVSSSDLNHRLNFRFDYQIDPNNSLTIRPSFSFQQNEGLDNTFGQTTLENELLNQTDYRFQTDLTGLNFSNDILYRHRFGKRGRTLSLNVDMGYNETDGTSFLDSENLFFNSRVPSDSLEQFSDLLSQGWNVSTNVAYTEPLGERSLLQLNYRTRWQQTDSDERTFDFEEAQQDYTSLNRPLSNTFVSDYFTHQLGSGVLLRGQKVTANIRLTAQYAQLDNTQTFPKAFDLQRTFFNLLPNAFFRYTISKSENLRAGYRTSTSPPSITQLQEVVDNTNPLQLRTGNPDLAQNYSHRLFTRYSKTSTDKSNVFYVLLSGTYMQDYVANSTFIASQDTVVNGLSLARGAQLIRPVNLDGYWNARSYVTYGLPVSGIKSNVNVNLSASFQRTPGLINDELNYANSTTLGAGLTLSSNISENVDFKISSNSSYNTTQNSLNTAVSNDFFNQTSTLFLNLIFWDGFVFRTDISHQYYAGLSDALDPNYVLWNMSLGKKFFKDRSGEVQLTVFDLLKQNTSVQRNITEAYIEDVQTEVLQQYVMLTFTYRLRSFGKAPVLEKRSGRDDFGGRGRWD